MYPGIRLLRANFLTTSAKLKWVWLVAMPLFASVIVPAGNLLHTNIEFLVGVLLLAVIMASLVPFFMNRLYLLIVIMVFLMPVGVLGQFGSYSSSSIIVVTSVLQLWALYAFFVWGISIILNHNSIFIPKAMAFLLLFGIALLAAGILGDDIKFSSTYTLRYYVSFGIFIVFINSVVRTKAQLIQVIWAIFLSFSATSLIEAALWARLIDIPSLSYLNDTTRVAEFYRTSSIHGGMATTSLHLMIGITMAICLFKISGNLIAKILLVFGLILMLIADFRTQSLTGILALAPAIGIVFATSNIRYDAKEVIRKFFIMGLYISLFGIIFFTAFSPLRERLVSKVEEVGDKPYYMLASGRVGGWIGTMKLVVEKPWGVGPGNSGWAIPKYIETYPEVYSELEVKDKGLYLDPHNTYLFAMTEAGVLGALFWFMSLIVIAKRFWKTLISSIKLRLKEFIYIGSSLFGTLIGTAIFISFSDHMTDKYLWLVIALLIVYAGIVGRETEYDVSSNNDK